MRNILINFTLSQHCVLITSHDETFTVRVEYRECSSLFDVDDREFGKDAAKEREAL